LQIAIILPYCRESRGALRPVGNPRAARHHVRQPPPLPRARCRLRGGHRHQHPREPPQAARGGRAAVPRGHPPWAAGGILAHRGGHPGAAGHGRARQLGLGAPRRRFSTLRSTLRPMLLPDRLHQQPHPCEVLVWLPSDDVASLPVPGLLGPAPRDGLRRDVLAS
jgi:hypothetical protein